MDNATDKLIHHYGHYDESGRMFGSVARSLEYHTTRHYLQSEIPPQSSVLELGAGCGAYTGFLAERVRKIHTSDIVPAYVQALTKKFSDNENVLVEQINAYAFSPATQYDTVLCMGPLYHLQRAEERKVVIINCIRSLIPGGKLFFSYINKHYAMSLYLKNRIFFQPEDYDHFSHSDYNRLGGIDPFMEFSYYTTPEEITAELTGCGLTILRHAGVDGHFNLFAQSLDAMSDTQFADFLQYHLSTCESPSTLGISSHGLVVCTIE